MHIKFYIIILAAFCFFYLHAQNNDAYQKALKLRQDGNYKEALPAFQALLKTDSANAGYVENASIVYSKYGYFFVSNADEKLKYYKTATYLAKKAIDLNPKSADAHYAYALALGRINENASSKQKISNSKLIKAECEKAIANNPMHSGAYHILGRWHRTIAGFSAIEKAMINSFFGGVPEGGSYQDAVNSFMKAISFEPKILIHQYELAQTYYEMDKKTEAKVWVNKALNITPVIEDDKKAKMDAEKLLKKLQ